LPEDSDQVDLGGAGIIGIGKGTGTQRQRELIHHRRADPHASVKERLHPSVDLAVVELLQDALEVCHPATLIQGS
jgi:hypothetical protein